MRNGLILAALALLAPVAAAAEPEASISSDAGCTACAPCACCDLPWTMRAKLLYLKRESPDATPLVSANDSTQVLFDASQYDFDLAPGADISVSRRLGASGDFEIRYFGLYDSSATENFTLNVLSEFSGQNITVFIPPATFFSEYTTSINSVEVSPGIYTAGGLRLQLGFRWLQLDEELRGTIVEPTADVITNTLTRAENNLYGAQVGADGALWQRGRLSLNGFGKAGIYCNDIDAGVFSLDSRGLGLNARDSDNTVAFVGELGLELQYALTRTMSVTFGGQLMWITGVAVAGEQSAGVAPLAFADISPPGGALTAQTDGDVFLYGLSAGVVFRW